MTRSFTRLTWLLLVGLFCAASAAQAQEWGNLKGRFVYPGTPPTPRQIQTPPDIKVEKPLVDDSLVVGKDGGIANIVIYVRTKDVKEHPDYAQTANEKIPYDNRGFQFVPHVLTMRQSQTLVFTNSDPVSHNSNFQPIGDTGVNPLLPAGAKEDYKANREQTIPQKVGCNIHPWMGGYILIRKNPYHTVTKEDGTFELKNLPAGELEFQVWHEKSGYLAAKPDWDKGRFTMKIKSGENDLGEIKVDPKLFQK